MRTLVIGCDASGKSTLMAGVHERFGDNVIESSKTTGALAFKMANLDRPIDEEFINEREAFYLKIEHQDAADLSTDNANTITANSSLVTRFSHNIMRRCLGLHSYTDQDIIRLWEREEASVNLQPPAIIALTHAPIDVIKQRIIARQRAKRKDEKFWGFNSPFFLEQYQQGWLRVLPALGATGTRCIQLDTSRLSPSQSIERYSGVRAAESHGV